MRNEWGLERAHHDSSIGLNRAAAPEAIRGDGEAGEAGMSWKIEVMVDDSGEWEGDPWRFETEREALAYARDLEFRWSAVRDKRVVKSEDPVNHRWPQCRHSAGSTGNSD